MFHTVAAALVPSFAIFAGILLFACAVSHPFRDRDKKMPAWVWYYKDMQPRDPDDDTSPRGYWTSDWDEANPPVYDLAERPAAA